jgi:hypothetical protein
MKRPAENSAPVRVRITDETAVDGDGWGNGVGTHCPTVKQRGERAARPATRLVFPLVVVSLLQLFGEPQKLLDCEGQQSAVFLVLRK